MDSGSPAEKAGMIDGELLLEVNGESVESLKHEAIVNIVRESGEHVYLTTITPQGLEFYTQVGITSYMFFPKHNLLCKNVRRCLYECLLHVHSNFYFISFQYNRKQRYSKT